MVVFKFGHTASTPSSPVPISSSSLAPAKKEQPLVVASKMQTPLIPQKSSVEILIGYVSPLLQKAKATFQYTVKGTYLTGRFFWYVATAGLIVFIPLSLMLEQENMSRLQAFHQRSQRQFSNPLDSFLGSLPSDMEIPGSGAGVSSAVDNMLALPGSQ